MKVENKSACCSVGRSSSDKKMKLEELTPSKSITSVTASKEGMIYVPGGEFFMGTTDGEGFPADGEGPVRKIKVDPFYIDSCTVTNSDFATFIKETGYKTEAERFGNSFVFYSLLSKRVAKQVKNVVHGTPWWCNVEGAYWYQPEGPDSNIDDRMDHPVVHISWNDAVAYCEWAGKRLPTEAEWEYAARGGLEQKRYPWGDELVVDGQHYCNIWQGTFPKQNTKEDGYEGTAPAKSFPPNGFGLYNISGNVWEWCSDWFSRSVHRRGGRDNPKGPETGNAKVIRGGSYLCHKSYCNRYRVAARSSNTMDSSSGHVGFRCVVDG